MNIKELEKLSIKELQDLSQKLWEEQKKIDTLVEYKKLFDEE